MKHTIQLSSESTNIMMKPKAYAMKILRGAMGYKDHENAFDINRISKSMRGAGLCHGHTARALADAGINKTFHIAILGRSFVVHSVLLDARQKVVYDRDGDAMISIEPSDTLFKGHKLTYDHLWDMKGATLETPMTLDVLEIFNVGDLIT